jgi:hypothetical protein
LYPKAIVRQLSMSLLAALTCTGVSDGLPVNVQAW